MGLINIYLKQMNKANITNESFSSDYYKLYNIEYDYFITDRIEQTKGILSLYEIQLFSILVNNLNIKDKLND